MMENLFYAFLEISVTVSAVILVIFMLMPVLKKRFNAKWRYWIWLLLAIRLLIPINYHVPQPIVQIQIPQENNVTQAVPFVPPVAQVQSGHILQVFSVSKLLAIIWIAGSILLIVYRFSAYFVFLHKIRRWSRMVDDENALENFKSVKLELAVRNHIAFQHSKNFASPMMTGFFRPILLLPETEYTTEELRLILKHELIHLKRRDIWYKLLLTLVNSVHWFNPIVWMMVYRASADTELVCDAEVVKGQDEGYRRRYGNAILSAIRQSRISGMVFSTYFNGGVKAIKQRIFSIFDTGKKHRGIAAFCIVVFAVAIVGALVACGAMNQNVQTQNDKIANSNTSSINESSQVSQSSSEKSGNTSSKYNSTVSNFVNKSQSNAETQMTLKPKTSSGTSQSVKPLNNNGWVVYSTNKDGYKLHKKRQDGTEDTVIVNDIVEAPCLAGEWVYYFPDLSEIDRVNLDGSQKTRICSTDAFDNLDGSTAVTAEYKDGYILYKLSQLTPVGDNKSTKVSYYKLDLNQKKIIAVK